MIPVRKYPSSFATTEERYAKRSVYMTMFEVETLGTEKISTQVQASVNDHAVRNYR